MQLPPDWRRRSTRFLEEIIEGVDEDVYPDVILVAGELEMRYAMQSDARIAEMFGAPWLEPS